jgi:hypothetical protein
VSATADSLVELGNELSDQGRLEEAAEAYRRAIATDPSWSVPWYNLGLNFKRRRLWHESLEANRSAVTLDPEDGAAWWNLGIAATATGAWTVAREAWSACGVAIPVGIGPLKLNLGAVPLRLNPNGDAEVVWGDRIDPARAILANIPYPRSGFRHGDTVLHDGAPNGYRLLGSREVPVFDVLQRLDASPYVTTEVLLIAGQPVDLEALEHLTGKAEVVFEDWTASVQNLCRLCSEGVPHAVHDAQQPEWLPERHVGMSCLSGGIAEELLRGWERGGRGRQLVNVTHH